MDLDKLLWKAVVAIHNAGERIIEVYESDSFETEIKEDNSPLTKADLVSNEVICDALKITSIPILSEEMASVEYQDRKDWEFVWIVDPLDGTKEFIKRNGEFTVNIGLIQNQKPILGLVYIPVSKTLYFGHTSLGAFKTNMKQLPDSLNTLLEKADKLPLQDSGKNDKIQVVASRSHTSEKTSEFIQSLGNAGDIELVSKGSALKLCLIAEGTAHVYPRFVPTMEWDTAAGHALINITGGSIVLEDGSSSLDYNREDLLNPFFIATQKGFNIPQ